MCRAGGTTRRQFPQASAACAAQPLMGVPADPQSAGVAEPLPAQVGICLNSNMQKPSGEIHFDGQAGGRARWPQPRQLVDDYIDRLRKLNISEAVARCPSFTAEIMSI